MKKKFLMSLAPLLGIAALAVVPAAQAAPHFYSEGSIIGATPETVIGWGTINLVATEGSPPGAELTCHNSIAGTAFNPVGGGAGEGTVQVFSTYDCEQHKICPETAEFATEVVAERLPWHSVLTEEVAPTIRLETLGTPTTGIKAVVECKVGGSISSKIPYVVGKKKGSAEAEKGQRPIEEAGTSALHPSFANFEGSGELEVEGSLGKVRGKTEGAVKTLGYNAQELFSVKNP